MRDPPGGGTSDGTGGGTSDGTGDGTSGGAGDGTGGGADRPAGGARTGGLPSGAPGDALDGTLGGRISAQPGSLSGTATLGGTSGSAGLSGLAGATVRPDLSGLGRLSPEALPPPRRGPLALLPLKLEYRFVNQRAPILMKDTSKLRSELSALNTVPVPRTRVAREARNQSFQRILERNSKPTFENLQLPSTEALWVRWYPDENFAENGVDAITDAEQQAKATFERALGRSKWWDTSDPIVDAAWQGFAQSVGAYRAVHLMRASDERLKGDDPSRRGRITALPDKVVLYAITDNPANGLNMELIAEGSKIPPNAAKRASPVAYTPEATDPGGWLVDFGAAIDLGMGVRITDDKAIKHARDADWIIALGMNAGTAHDDLEALLTSHIANGDFAVLPQDSPTNNTPDTLSYRQRPERHLHAFTRRATSHETAEVNDGKQRAADLLAEALGVPVELVRTAVDAADTGFEDAQAMLRIIGPALLDDSLDGVSPIDGVSEDRFIEVLAAAFVARGVLPAVRVGSSAYGIAPVINVRNLKIDPVNLKADDDKVYAFLADYAKLVRSDLPTVMDVQGATIEPGDPDASDKLFDALSLTSVSKRLDVSAADSDTGITHGLACPFVAGRQPNHQPRNYLRALRQQPHGDLADPDERNLFWPLLYRLARMSVERNTTSLLTTASEKLGFSLTPDALKNISDALRLRGLSGVASSDSTAGSRLFSTTVPKATRNRFTRVNAGFVSALTHLETVASRPEGHAELEMLMFEVIDLLQHRVDALATGLAYARLKASRDAGVTGLQGGYYGILGKLRPASVTGTSNGYLQAPSIPQAITAALLRSAHLRHKAQGAFAIKLSSTRTRRALQLLDLIAKGHDLQEGLGLRGERWLHDQKLDAHIQTLRARFPLTSQQGDRVAVRRVFNGLDFIQAQPSGEVQTRLHARLSDDLDALSDVVMAEAVHQRALGQSGAANAWLGVLSGHPPPGVPSVLRTQRHGQGSNHRVSLMLEAPAPSASLSPRAIAEPSLAAFARAQMPAFDALQIVLSSPQGPDVSIDIAAQLKVEPIDLIIGGAAELEVRAKSHLHTRLASDAALRAQFPLVDGERLLLERRSDASSTELDKHLARAIQIRKIVQSGRPMEAGDLNAAAAVSDGELDEARALAAMTHALNDLRQRLTLLVARLSPEITSLRTSASQYNSATMELERATAAEDPAAIVDAAMTTALARRLTLAEALTRIAVYAQPDALRPFHLEDALNDPLGFFGGLDDRLTRLDRTLGRLRQALSDFPATGHATLPEARAALTGCMSALKGALDGDGMIVLPPLPRADRALRPAVGAARSATSSLGSFAGHREALRQLNTLLTTQDSNSPALFGAVVTDAASINASDPTEDQRSENTAPRVHHHGVFLSEANIVTRNHPVAGIVCDEWSVERPSDVQLAGIAINYDSPQAEAPNCILLGVPSDNSARRWTQAQALNVITEALTWMKIRALSSEHHIMPAAQFPGANTLSPNTDSGNKRLPLQHPFSVFSDLASGGLDVARLPGDASNAVHRASNLAERRGYTKRRE